MKCVFLLVACVCMLGAAGQDKLLIMGKEPNQYVVYTVKSETSLQNVSNQFGQSVTKLSTYNGLSAAKKLAKGTEVKIPLTQYNLVRTKGDRNSAPLYHAIVKGDNLYRLSKEIKVPLATLKQWNGLTSDAVKIGELVIVGYMVNARMDEQPETVVAVKEETKPLPKPEVPLINTTPSKTEAKAADKSGGATVAPVQSPAKEVQRTTPIAAVITQPDPSGYVPKDGDEGFFALSYAQGSGQTKQFHSGDAATFKTISGWSDRKYYVLINDVAPETIVRITAPNNKSICAKVLGPLQETKGGTGLLLRMSNSAASTLGITDARFTVTVTYFE